MDPNSDEKDTIQDDHRPTSFADLPVEVTCMVLEQLIADIDIAYPRDLSRWSYRDPKAYATTKATTTKVMPVCAYHSNPGLRPGEQLHSLVRVTVHPRPDDHSQWQAGSITVLIPRKWHELLISGIFRDTDLAFFGQYMEIQVTSMRTRNAPYIAHGPDTRVESVVRDLLAWKREIRVDDLRLHAVHTTPANLNCFLPRVERLNVFHAGFTTWSQQYSGHHLDLESVASLHTIRALTLDEVASLRDKGALPRGMKPLFHQRDATLDAMSRWNQRIGMSLGKIRRYLAMMGWTDTTQHCILIRCIAEGSEGWMNSRVVHIGLVMNRDWEAGWTITAAALLGDQCSDLVPHSWASLRHLNL